jgi:uncharacterized membrane protein YdbT with pleckstrin-like domain
MSEHLSTDEKVIYKFRISRLEFLREYLLLAFVIIISATSLFTTFLSKIAHYIILGTIATILFYAFSLLAVVLLVRVEYKIWSRRYALTTKRVIISEGIFTEKFKSTVYDKITDVGLNQSFMDKILNIGTILVDTAGGDGIEITLEKVARPIFVKNKISEMQSSVKVLVEEVRPQPVHAKRRK